MKIAGGVKPPLQNQGDEGRLQKAGLQPLRWVTGMSWLDDANPKETEERPDFHRHCSGNRILYGGCPEGKFHETEAQRKALTWHPFSARVLELRS